MGRIVVEEGMRNKSIGKEITNIGIRFLSEKYPNHEIIISAQHRLQKFYEGLALLQEARSTWKMTLIIYKCICSLSNYPFIK